jgi:hypothetical protein
MGAEGRSEDVVGVAHIGDPVAHRLVDRLLERGLSRGDADDLGAQKAHAGNVERLALHVDRAHVDPALEAEAGRCGGCGDAMLAGTCFGNDSLLSHASGEQDLAEGVVDLVGAGVEQVLALEVDFCAAKFLGEAFRKIERGGPADEFPEQ